MTNKTLNISAIRIDGGTQARVAIHQEAVAEYANVIEAGDILPAITVFHDGADYWLADGFHRLFAHKMVGKASIVADVLTGTCRDAVLYSLAANTVHGLRPTNDDKRKAAGIMLADAEWSQLSDREIAKHCGCSHTLVGQLRHPKPEAAKATAKATKPASSGNIATDTDQSQHEPDSAASGNIATAAAKPLTEKQAAAEKAAEDAHGDTDPVAMWEAAENKVAFLQKELDAAEANDAKAEILKYKRIADLSNRRQNELMDTVNAREKELQRMANVLRRIGKALGEDDTSKLAAMVEALVRGVK